MSQILRCDWLPERARWSYLARSGLRAVSRKKNFSEVEAGLPKCCFVICAVKDVFRDS